MPQVRVIRTGQTAFVPVSPDGGQAAAEAMNKFVDRLRDLGFGADAAETAVRDVSEGLKTPSQAATSITPKKTGTTGKVRKPSATKKAAAAVLRKVGKALQKTGNKKKK